MSLPSGPVHEVRAGTRLGRYEILVAVAQGGMARVWAAKQHGQRGFSKLVAIKTILPQLAKDPAFESMFLDEAHLSAGVHHPNVCEIFDLGEEQGTLYIAMEWVNGEALNRIVKPPVPKGEKGVSERLNARIAARIVADAAKGLHAAHELRDDSGQLVGLVHRDVSPQNILISLDGVVKVTDFGVAKALAKQQEATMAGQVKGKVAYMAPEQARGAAIDRRSDVFALGIVLYEITTAVRPFAGTNELEVMRSLAAGRFDPPSAVVAGYPKELESIVLTAMSMDPDQRFPSADAMRLALEEWLAHSGPVVSEAHVAATVRERVGRHVDERIARIRERTRVAAPEASALPEPSSPFAAPPPHEASSSFAQAPSAVSTLSHASAPSAVSTVSHTSAPSAVSTVSHASAPSAISQFSPVVQTSPSQSMARPSGGSSAAKTALFGVAVGVGVFALVAVGGGSLYMLRARSHAAAQPAATAGSAAAPAPASTAAQKEVLVELVTPKSGVTLLVDGVVQPVGQLSFARPAPGVSKKLTARADGYKEGELRFDDKTEKLEIALELDKEESVAEQPIPVEKLAEQKPAEPKSGAPTSGGEKPSEPAGDKPKPKGPVKVDIPDNPF
ncbi:MAG: serine/threonine protein kinase [Myxococcales bacterium]|nr:serine/threonine protein kinase [Myxococcales bacterium]